MTCMVTLGNGADICTINGARAAFSVVCWDDKASDCRSALRYAGFLLFGNYIGFRIALSPSRNH